MNDAARGHVSTIRGRSNQQCKENTCTLRNHLLDDDENSEMVLVAVLLWMATMIAVLWPRVCMMFFL